MEEELLDLIRFYNQLIETEFESATLKILPLLNNQQITSLEYCSIQFIAYSPTWISKEEN
jgi:hypothetical protein